MSQGQRIPSTSPQLLHHRQLIARGVTRAELHTMTHSGSLHRVHRGWYTRGDDWNALSPEHRHLAQLEAVHHAAHEPPIFAGLSAAVLHGLPIHGLRNEPVHTATSSTRTGRRTSSVIRHRWDIDPADVTQSGEFQGTSLDRTLSDLGRFDRPERAFACTDAALARFALLKHRKVDESALREWREQMRERSSALARSRGIATWTRLFELADPRSESVLESVGRLRLLQLGYDVDLQVPVPSPTGGLFYMDLELKGLATFVECDGKSKYLDAALRSGASIEQVIFEEKQREDHVRGNTGKRVIRLGSADVSSPERLATLLRSYGVPPPRHRQ